MVAVVVVAVVVVTVVVVVIDDVELVDEVDVVVVVEKSHDPHVSGPVRAHTHRNTDIYIYIVRE